ncbi:hypothetical protein ACEPAG_484 [Sanghuangporus baumii]
MVASSLFALVLATSATTSWAGPLNKRIAQTIADSTAKWVQACTAAGGADQCNPLSQTAFMTLLAAAGPCDQQNAADQMIDLAKQLNNDADMIKSTQIFVQQPRNSPDSFQIPYCQQAPKNSELNGLFQCQFEGTKDTFVGNLQAGAQGTVPFGLSSLETPRSCPANPQGGITDGSQLSDVTDDPGLSNVNSSGGSSNSSSGSNSSDTGSASSSAAASSVVESATATATVSDTSAATATVSESDTSVASPTEVSSCDTPSSDASSGSATGNVAAAPSSSSSSNFILQNGLDAQKLNAQFQALSQNSSCDEGETACVGTSFALCANGAFQLMDCGKAAGNTCAALPLVNKAGTTVTCVQQDQALQRIADTGATGGLTGSD